MFFLIESARQQEAPILASKLKNSSWVLGPVSLESSPQLYSYIAFSDHLQLQARQQPSIAIRYGLLVRKIFRVRVFCHPPWQRENSCLPEQNDRHEKSLKKIAVRWEQESLTIPLSFCVQSPWTPTHETKKRQSKNISERDPSMDLFFF